MRTIIWFLYFWLYLIVVLPEYWRVCRMEKRGETERHDRLVRKHVQNWAGRLLRLAGAEITTTGRENIPEGPVVFVANHQGYFDIPLMLTQLDKPNPIVAKKEIMKLPMIRGWMEQLRCVFLDREDPRKSMESLKSAQELLGKGYSVTIFPEGTRNSGGELGEFKAGAIRVATRAHVPVVPVCIDGSYKLMKKGSLWIHPAKVKIRILPAISTEEMSREEIRALPEQLREQIGNGIKQLRKEQPA